MKSASFFLLSLSLHAAALVYPVSFYAPNPGQLIQVTILPMDQEAKNGEGGNNASAPHVARGGSKSNGGTRRVVEPTVEQKSLIDAGPQALSADAVATVVDSNSEEVSPTANYVETGVAAISGPASNDSNTPGKTGLGGSNGTGFGSFGTGLGSKGTGLGSSGKGTVLTQARYRDTPKPIYPENARREGREGRVILRVLIDNQGKAKSVELNTSSGSQALDRAATDAIKRWRFHPAYEGNIPVDSWVNVPIDFRLTDARN
jgi:periplasmic protein TonB